MVAQAVADAEAVEGITMDYLWENIGHMTSPGTPRFHSESSEWHVAILCRSEFGALIVGECVLDRTGKIVMNTSREEMSVAADDYVKLGEMLHLDPATVAGRSPTDWLADAVFAPNPDIRSCAERILDKIPEDELWSSEKLKIIAGAEPRPSPTVASGTKEEMSLAEILARVA